MLVPVPAHRLQANLQDFLACPQRSGAGQMSNAAPDGIAMATERTALVNRRFPAAAAIGSRAAWIQLRHSTWIDRLGMPITSPGLTTATSWAEMSGIAVSRTFDHRAP